MLLAAAATLFLQYAPAESLTTRSAAGSVPAAVALRVDRAPVLDGRLDDAAWRAAAPITGLVQRDPDEGQPVSEPIEVRMLYDGDALYVGARLFDRDPDGIINRLGRRDAATHSDEFRVFLDSYYDHRTAFEFAVNPAGVKSDVLIGDDGAYSDDSWDPVWQAATTIDSLGWTVEMRIPFSQVRFSGAPVQVWGVCVERWIQRKNELAMFPFVPKTESGLVSRYADLVGLRDLAASERLEVLPYAVARGTYRQPTISADPFERPTRYFQGLGGDVKYAVTSNLTLNATVNPDFGQVEVDPAFVNLTAFEQFLAEHRPFFVEGGNIFGFGGNAGGLSRFKDSTLYFYSRRIGRPPQGPVTSPGQFVDAPPSANILGAAKLTGTRANGWSVGVLDAVTAREWASVADTTTGLRHHDEVEPLTNYFAARVKRDLRRGNTTVGVIATAVRRRLDTPALNVLRQGAYAGAVDVFHRWGKNRYTLAASFGGSSIRGDTLAIQQAQRSSNRYYQRPDARSFAYDPRRRSLSGVSGDLYFNKVGGNWTWSLAASTISPGFEVNDLGFQTRVDRIAGAAALQYRWTRPGRVFRQAKTLVSLAQGWNYDGNRIQRTASVYGFGQFRNFWSGDLSASYSAGTLDDRLTRGGPLARKPPAWQASGEVYTDDRKQMGGYLYASVGADSAGGRTLSILPLVTLRHGSALSVSLGPAYFVGRTAAQYVARFRDSTATATLGSRYVFAELEQHSLDVTLRLNATFSPALSLQLYAQPFTFSAGYRAFKELATRRAFAFNTYGRDNGSTIHDTVVVSGADTVPGYAVDPDGPGPAGTVMFKNPDFRTRSLQVNAVLRWEYRPGSTLYVVWTEGRSGFFPFDDRFDVARDLGRDLLRDRPTNVVSVKFTYWLNL